MYFLVTEKSFTVFHWVCLLNFFLSFYSCITYLFIRAHFCHKMKVDDLQSTISQIIAADIAKYLAKFHGSKLTEKMRVTKLNSWVSFPKVCWPYPSQNISLANVFQFTFSVPSISESTFSWSSVWFWTVQKWGQKQWKALVCPHSMIPVQELIKARKQWRYEAFKKWVFIQLPHLCKQLCNQKSKGPLFIWLISSFGPVLPVTLKHKYCFIITNQLITMKSLVKH